MNNVQLTEDSISDIFSLPEELKQECLETLRRLDKNIHLGQALQNKNSKDLSGYYKLYFAKATYRIVYHLVDGKTEVIGVAKKAEVVGVGKRDKEEIYNTVHQRISAMKNAMKPDESTEANEPTKPDEPTE